MLGASREAFALAEEQDAARGRLDAARIAAFAARQLSGATRIASFSIGGWDTHARQAQRIQQPLGELETAILELRRGLGTHWDRTAVVAVSEFGRTARANGAGGTDHGHGGAIVLAGGAIRGGRAFGRWPGLGEGRLYQDRDLMPTGDARRTLGWLLAGLYGLDGSSLENYVFPGLDLGGDPGVIA